MQQASANLIRVTAPAPSPSTEKAASRGPENTDGERQRFGSALNEAQSTSQDRPDAETAQAETGSQLPPDGRSLPADDNPTELIALDAEVVGYFVPETRLAPAAPGAGTMPVYTNAAGAGGSTRTEAFGGMAERGAMPVMPGSIHNLNGPAASRVNGALQDDVGSPGAMRVPSAGETVSDGRLAGRGHSAEYIVQAAVTSSQLDDQLSARRSRFTPDFASLRSSGLTNGTSTPTFSPSTLDAGAQTAANQRFSLLSGGDAALFDELSTVLDSAGKSSSNYATSTTPTPSLALAPLAAGVSTAPPLTTAAMAPVTPAFSIDAPVLDPAWQNAVNERVVWMAGRNLQSAELKLHPAELGPLQVQLSVDDKVVSVSISAAHPQTREALEGAIPKLREMLNEQGMDLGGASVDDGNVNGGAADGSEDSFAQDGESRSAPVSAREELASDHDSRHEDALDRVSLAHAATDDGVDFFA